MHNFAVSAQGVPAACLRITGPMSVPHFHVLELGSLGMTIAKHLACYCVYCVYIDVDAKYFRLLFFLQNFPWLLT